MTEAIDLPKYGDTPHHEWFDGHRKLVAGIAKVLLPVKPDPGAKPWRAWCRGFTTDTKWVDCDTETRAFVEVRRMLKKYGISAMMKTLP